MMPLPQALASLSGYARDFQSKALLVTNTSSFTVRFRADGSVQGTGFYMRYFVLPAGSSFGALGGSGADPLDKPADNTSSNSTGGDPAAVCDPTFGVRVVSSTDGMSPQPYVTSDFRWRLSQAGFNATSTGMTIGGGAESTLYCTMKPLYCMLLSDVRSSRKRCVLTG